MPFSSLPILRTLILATAFSGALLTTGCAQMRSPDYYAQQSANSSTDATYQAQGGVSHSMLSQAPSQVQIPLNFTPDKQQPEADNGAQAATGAAPGAGTSVPPVPSIPAAGANARMKEGAATAPAPLDHPSQRAFLPQAETFVGTIACPSPSAQCAAQRITLTLGPNGRWRSRATYLANQGSQPDAPQAQQGCWNVAGDHPAHVLLLDARNNPQAELLASSDNVLSIRTFQGRTLTLNYTLTRQPDLDPIDELSKQPLPNCP
ncbi:hypothetical protein [Bordetella sp. FB-8]|uniref:hypothetical protein n=1 Tax=Bordetella sp. FB-8 TaxID=1159870 RepID=UPI000399EBD0|nr:hypothetical protein [Bordetella sp. FB-8]